MNGGSRIPGFYRLPLAERRSEVVQRRGLSAIEAAQIWDSGGLHAELADKVVENVLGVYSLPFGVALNVTMNDRDYLVPMVVEEPSVIAAASNAARMVRSAGGFQAELLDDLMTAQVQLFDVPDPAKARRAIVENTATLLEVASRAVPNLIHRGGGPRSLEVRDLGDGMLVVHIHVDCRDAMGANLVNTVAEALGRPIAELAQGSLGLRILTNWCDRRRVRASARVHATDLLMGRPTANTPGGLQGAGAKDGSGSGLQSWRPTTREDKDVVVDAIVQASRFAEADPYRAATHNKGVMNGIDSVAIATGNDYRAVEAGAHAHAARSGRYRPLSTWRRDGQDLVGEIELPLALGIVGGTLRVHPAARLALDLSGVTSAGELSMLTACVGLASNLAALRALATEGIQQGHMALHARSLASAAGAIGDEVEWVAERLSLLGEITLVAAEKALETYRAGSADGT
jgi:hydroxymethylglutaryl-CoA reductase